MNPELKLSERETRGYPRDGVSELNTSDMDTERRNKGARTFVELYEEVAL